MANNMQPVGTIIVVVLFAVAVYYVQQLIAETNEHAFKRHVIIASEVLNEIKDHAMEFNQKTVIKVSDNIYVAVGYALANSIMVVGPSSVLIVDVTESYESGREILAAFRNITDLPITDILYTHNHADHVGGAKAFAEESGRAPTIWAHALIVKAFSTVVEGVSQALYTRAMRQFGVFLPELSSGIGLKLLFGKEKNTHAPIYPNRLVNGEEENVTMAGLPMRIVYIPGETDDQIGVWIPAQKAFLCADDFYKSFPNLYAIRGTKSRNLLQWVRSLDKIINLEPELLVPSHTRPLIGRSNILENLISYRDGIQFVHDQTVRMINQGRHPDEIANILTLPESLRSNPHLKEFYGTVAWSAKSVFVDYLGWFSGDPVELCPLPPIEKANRMLKLVGHDKIIQAARSALESEDFQWSLELVSYCLRVNPGDKQAKDLKVEALTELGSRQLSLNGRNYYLTVAMETATGFRITPAIRNRMMAIDAYPIEMIMSSFSSRFKPDKCGEKKETVFFELSSPSTNIHIEIRNSVAIVRFERPKKWDIRVKCTQEIWRNILKSERSAVVAVMFGDLDVEGGALALKSFFSCFDQNIQFEG